MQAVQHISVYIDRSPADVYAFVSNPENLSLWAGGLAESEVCQEGDQWIADAFRQSPDQVREAKLAGRSGS